MTRERAVGVFQSRHFWLFGALLFAAAPARLYQSRVAWW
jgi:hypothetical protein